MDEEDLVGGGSNNYQTYSVGQIKYAKYESTLRVDNLMKNGKKSDLQQAWEEKKFYDKLDQIVSEKLDRPDNLSLLEKKTEMAVAQGVSEEEIEHIWEEAYGQVRVNANGKISGSGGTQKRKRADSPAQPAKEEKTADKSAEELFLKEWEQNLNEIFEKATEPLRTFAGAVTTQLGLFDARKVLVWKTDKEEDRYKIVKSGAKTVDEFVKFNKELGALPLLTSAPPPPPSPQKKTVHKDVDEDEDDDPFGGDDENTNMHAQIFALLGKDACFGMGTADGDFEDAAKRVLEAKAARTGKPRPKDQNPTIYNAVMALRENNAEMRFAPAWVFSTMGNPVFYRLYSDGMMGAIRIAHSQITRIPNCRDFTIKELICSSEVMDMFAFKVATTWMGANTGSAREGGGYRRNIYENVNETNRILAFKIEQCLVFFESVYRVPNPLLSQFDKYVEKFPAKNTPEMKQFRELLPKYELVYRE